MVQSSGSQGHTLLLVDDSSDNLDLWARRLQRQGYRVLVADDGRRALETFRDQSVDLVVLDTQTQGLDGIQVLTRWRETHSQSELPVIMTSALDDPQDVIRALDLGANDYLTKPVDFPILLARIQAQLRTKVCAAPPEPRLEELEPGAVVASKYRLMGALGSGAFGDVYRARHVDLDSEVAVKILKPDITDSQEALSRFRREGISACRLKHPNAVLVTDFGITRSDVAYLVMELLEGESLARRLRSRGPLSPPRCLELLQPICDVLTAAHSVGVVHRDIKPENIFLQRTPSGETVKVLDFGIAKLADGAPGLTAEGMVLGTPAYIAPERVLGQPFDGSSDVYSLGVMLFLMLTGRLPFLPNPSNPVSVLANHVKDAPPPLRRMRRELPPRLEELVAAALAKAPDQRPDPATLADQLADIVGDAAEPGPTASLPMARPQERPSPGFWQRLRRSFGGAAARV